MTLDDLGPGSECFVMRLHAQDKLGQRLMGVCQGSKKRKQGIQEGLQREEEASERNKKGKDR